MRLDLIEGGDSDNYLKRSVWFVGWCSAFNKWYSILSGRPHRPLWPGVTQLPDFKVQLLFSSFHSQLLIFLLRQPFPTGLKNMHEEDRVIRAGPLGEDHLRPCRCLGPVWHCRDWQTCWRLAAAHNIRRRIREVTQNMRFLN